MEGRGGGSPGLGFGSLGFGAELRVHMHVGVVCGGLRSKQAVHAAAVTAVYYWPVYILLWRDDDDEAGSCAARWDVGSDPWDTDQEW